MLKDTFNRVHDYLRISLTDSCNFRCQYCMPEENIQCMPSSKLMSSQEIDHLSSVFVSLGVKKIRLTGGEPLVRKEFAEIAQRLAKYPVKLTLTTNGVLADKFLPVFKDTGIKSVNVSLDTLKPDVFYAMTRRNQFNKVWQNIMLLIEQGFHVKINVVAMEGVVENEILDFVALTQDLPVHVRFIEFMPFEGNRWVSNKVVTATQMLKLVRESYQIQKLSDDINDTAKKYVVPGHKGTFAFITTMSEHFCGTCNRLRLTADGKIKNCLFGKEEIDLLSVLRNGGDVEPFIFKSVQRKYAVMGGQFEHGYKQTTATELENRSMIRIGG
ncbi:MAG: GTP 3',8-cyclase MoaA [Cyclobacteriaceae bacterium]|nr:GTP 3',8-cyclase MoaA [Cyclobacteriaceae bacterium]